MTDQGQEFDENRKFAFVRPEVVLKENTLGEVSLGEVWKGVKFELHQFPDLDGKLIWIPRLVMGRDLVKESLIGFGTKLESQSLSDEHRSRLQYCIDKLKLPLLLAVHLALNKPDTPLDIYQPRPDTSPPQILMGVVGEAGSGKSTLLSAISVKDLSEVGCFSLDTFSKNSWTSYLEYFETIGINKYSSEVEILEAIKQFREVSRQEGVPGEKSPATTAKKLLDDLLEKCIQKPDTQLFLIEGVAAPKDSLSTNILHLISLEALEAELRINQADLQTSDESLLVDEEGKLLARPYLYHRDSGYGLTPDSLAKVIGDLIRAKDSILTLSHNLAMAYSKRIHLSPV